jgi:hypothetical protein
MPVHFGAATSEAGFSKEAKAARPTPCAERPRNVRRVCESPVELI